MNKEKILALKEGLIADLKEEIEAVKSIELNRLYRMEDSEFDYHIEKRVPRDTWGFLETFNKDSACFCVVASNNSNYSDLRRRGWRGNLKPLGYRTIDKKLTPAKRSDLPLMIGIGYASVDMEALLKGKKKIKVIED